MELHPNPFTHFKIQPLFYYNFRCWILQKKFCLWTPLMLFFFCGVGVDFGSACLLVLAPAGLVPVT